MRTTHLFNQSWLFAAHELPYHAPDSAFTPITLPHTTALLPHHNFEVSEYAFVSTYRKHFTLPEPLAGRRACLDFDGAMIAATVTINGHTFAEHKGGYTPFSFDITPYLRSDGANLLQVRLDSTERPDIPPFGHVVDYLTFSGLYRDVWLRLVEPLHLTNVFVRPRDVLSTAPALDLDLHLHNAGEQPRSGVLSAVLSDPDGAPVAQLHLAEPVMLDPGASAVIPATIADLSGIRLWSLEQPALYTLRVDLHDAEGALIDSRPARFGFRTAHFDQDGSFYLNGQPLKIIGLNRHQTYPFIGAAAPARLQRRDAEILKVELGVNLVRTSHYPQSPHFLDRCDEIGLLVFEEIPGWQHIGDADWKALSLRDVRAMIERDWNHPSIILWGVRINESPDDHDFYTATNALARQLDPTRQTGGVRYHADSEFLEDVFTYNDFSNDVREPDHTPHLITEFNGHMFPTKPWDQEERLVEHALRHLRIQDKQIGNPRVAGAIGWCAFDYNTHVEFGSGDRICYHGVMDMFRLPKYAAYAYASQANPADRIILQPGTIYAKGERSVGGFEPTWVFTNCDAIEVFVGEESLGRFTPDRETFPHLPHPPIRVTGFKDFWGQKQHFDLRIVGFLGEEEVAEHRIAADGLPAALELHADAHRLIADGADMTRLVFRIVDRFGNRLPYTQSVVTFSVEGPAELIGENPFALMGGQAAVFVKAGHTPGLVTVRASVPRLAPAAVTIAIVGE